MTDRMRFGVFLAPFHKPGVNPTRSRQQDRELTPWLDRRGQDEAWIGEHHSAGSETNASPEIFIAAAAERMRPIRLGTGVVSVSRRNPLRIAERIVRLDHMTGGRVMLGVGPGAPPTDAKMIGLEPSRTRELLADGFGAIMQSLTSEEPVTPKNGRWDLREARLHPRRYSNPLFDICCAGVASPAGPRPAGRHGAGLLSIGATTAAGFDALALHRDAMEEEAKQAGEAVDRSKGRLVGLVHCAETEAQAMKDVGYGMEQWFHCFQAVAAVPQMAAPGNDVTEMIEVVNESGFGAIGTPDRVIGQTERLRKQSNGGFGADPILAHNWANWEATQRSCELIAREATPRFQGHFLPTMDAAARAEKRGPDLADRHAAAVEDMTERHAAEKAARIH